MSPQPYFDTEREPPADVQADCLLCHHHDEWGGITLRLAWFAEPSKVMAIPRCLDVEACRGRVLAAGESWPLLERGEQPGERRKPTEPLAPLQADAHKEAPDEWV